MKFAGTDIELQLWHGVRWVPVSRNKSGSWVLGAEGADSSAKRDSWRDMHDTQTYGNDFSALGAHISNDDRAFSILMGSLINDQQLIARILGDNGQVKWTGNIIVRSMNRIGDMNGSEQWMVTMAPGDIAVSPAMWGRVTVGYLTVSGSMAVAPLLRMNGICLVNGVVAAGELGIAAPRGWDIANSFNFNFTCGFHISNVASTHTNCRSLIGHGYEQYASKWSSEHRINDLKNCRFGIYDLTHRTTSFFPGKDLQNYLIWVYFDSGHYNWYCNRAFWGGGSSAASLGVYDPPDPANRVITVLCDFSGDRGQISWLLDGLPLTDYGLNPLPDEFSQIDILNYYWHVCTGQNGASITEDILSNFGGLTWEYPPPSGYLGWSP